MAKRSSAKAMETGSSAQVPSSDGLSFLAFAEEQFSGDIPGHFSRKDIRHPILRATPETERKSVIAIWKVLLRFMGDSPDYRSELSSSYQPNMGAVMTRLYSHLGMTPSEQDAKRSAAISPQKPTLGFDDIEKEVAKKKKRGGTLRRLKATLSRSFFKDDGEQTVFHLLPLEESLRSPLEQLHFVIGYGILQPMLRDEIYCMVLKQLTNNPFKNSVSRGWLILTLMAGCYTPSDWIMKYLVKFLEEGPPIYTTNVKRNLQRTLQNGIRHQPPSFVEMEACLQRKILEVNVTLMDGTNHSPTVDCATTARELCVNLAEMISLEERFGFSIYISMYNKVASLGNGSDQVFDSISQCEQIYREVEDKEGIAPWRLFFRKEIYCPWESAVSDSVATNLIFAQVVRGIMLGEYDCDQDQQLAVLAAQQYYIEYGSDISEDGLSALLPSYIPSNKLKADEDIPRWRKAIVKAHNKLFGNTSSKVSAEKVKQDVVHFSKTKWALSFSRYYDVTKLEGPDWPEENLAVAVNWTGVYVLHEGETLFEMAYTEIVSVSEGVPRAQMTSNQIVMFMLVNGAAVKFASSDGEDLRHLVAFMHGGLKKRSVYAVAVQNHPGAEGETDELNFQEGDLIVLSSPAGGLGDDAAVCRGRNDRTEESGQISTDMIYVLPTLAKPTEDILKMFQTANF